MEKSVCKDASGRRLAPVHALVLLAVAGASSFQAVAMDLNPNGDWQVRWDNTVKYSSGLRLESPDKALISGTGKINADDGDRSFHKGLMSSRYDLLSEFDAQKDGFGVRLSAAAWYDSVYNRTNANDSPATSNRVSVPFNQFQDGTRDTAGRKAEMLDWFMFGANDIGDSRLSYRLGQHSLIWGTSLFFGNNGIAKGMAPVDIYKLNIPGTQAKETTMPVPQLSTALQIDDATSVEAYVQFKYRQTRLAPSGSYFSSADFLGDGAEAFLLAGANGSTTRLLNAGTLEGPHSNNFGLALNRRSSILDADLGFYAIQYKDTTPQFFTQVANRRYWLVVPNDVRAFGASFGKLVGEANVSGEFSVRTGQPLVAKQGTLSFGPGTPNPYAGDPLYPTGTTEHLNLSTVTTFGPNALWGGASLAGEFAANHVSSFDDNPAKVDTTRNKTSSAVRVVFTPTYYQVRPGLDLSPSINLGWAFKGNSMIDVAFPFAGSPNRGGDITLGLAAVYLTRWTASLSWIHYLGKADTQPLLDRDYLRFSMQTTF